MALRVILKRGTGRLKGRWCLRTEDTSRKGFGRWRVYGCFGDKARALAKARGIKAR